MWTLRRRVFALCASAAALLGILAVAATVTASISRGQVTAVVDRYAPLRANAEQLLVAVVDQETGVRGYALNGTEADLAPYLDGLATERQVVAEMVRNLGDEAEIRQLLDAVVRQADVWRAAVAEPVIAAVRSTGRAAAQPLLDDAARQRFGDLRVAVARLQDAIIALRDEAAERARSSADTVVLLLIVAAGVVIVSGAGLLILLHRLVTTPVTELAARVRTVAGGEYDTAIASTTGSPELVALARDVDAMRQRIVSDLDEVLAARGRVEQANAALETKAAELAAQTVTLEAQTEVLIAQAAELERSNRDLEQFAYVASHDLQEPLRKVASFCQLLQRRYAGQLDERADQYIAFAVNGAQRMQRLINDLLAFSRIGRSTADFADVELDQVVAEATAALDTLVERTDAKVTWADLPVVRGEESLLGTLVENLIGNSIKFRRPDTPPRVNFSARRVGTEWEITCADNGIGIEREYAEKVFVLFQRLHPKEAYPGTGIGLAIAKKIVEHHGGRIWVDEAVTDGTTIRFTMPAGEESDG